jgi:hypothetical protein
MFTLKKSIPSEGQTLNFSPAKITQLIVPDHHINMEHINLVNQGRLIGLIQNLLDQLGFV